MKVAVFGASGMVGYGVLQECLKAPDVTSVLVIGRSSVGITHPKLQEIIHRDFTEFGSLKQEFASIDACFYCLGVSSVGMREEQYTHITYDYTLAAAEVLSNANPLSSFIYVSGAGTDSSEKGSSMWARVKGRTENALLRTPFAKVALFRPGVIRPIGVMKSKTLLYRFIYSMFGPVFGIFQALFPRQIATTETVGLAMLEVVRSGGCSAVIHPRDIYQLAVQAKGRNEK